MTYLYVPLEVFRFIPSICLPYEYELAISLFQNIKFYTHMIQ